MTILLETKKLTLQITSKLICHNLDLQIRTGEIIGVLGTNGSGKTTLLKTLAGLLPIASGEIWLSQQKMSTLSQKNIAQQLGFLFQDTQDIFPQTVVEFCSGGRYPHLNYFAWENEQDKKIIEKALYVMGLENHATQNINTLSGGERRRLAIATLLTQTPEIYLLDEPTNHLDLYFQIKVLNHFKMLAKQNSVSILMSLHDINLAAYYCDRVLILCGDGTFLLGDPVHVISKENLERIYQCPFELIASGTKKAWIPYLV
jgi:iron complex transport system ATP-binding protein